MRRYRRSPLTSVRSNGDDFYDEWQNAKPTIDVYVTDDNWQTTGLLDADGCPLQAYVGPDPIGFVWFEDE